MKLSVNGKSYERENPATITELLNDLGYEEATVVVEKNEEIIPKALYREATIKDGDIIEILHFVGGGM